MDMILVRLNFDLSGHVFEMMDGVMRFSQSLRDTPPESADINDWGLDAESSL